MKKFKALNNLLRTKHWLKNLLLFVPPFFGRVIPTPENITTSFLIFFSFSFGASAIYVFNDYVDREYDSFHPQKKNRPLVNGGVDLKTAKFIFVACVLIAFSIAYQAGQAFLFFLFIYFILNIIYTLYVKFIPIWDLFFIAFGFIIRILAGGNAFQVAVSDWLFLTVFFVSILLSAGKRLEEVTVLKQEAANQRLVLQEYPAGFLETVLFLSSTVSLMCYSLYSIEKGKDIFYTIPLVTFGLLRYLFMVKKDRGEPMKLLLEDRVLGGVFVAWILMVFFLRYYR